MNVFSTRTKRSSKPIQLSVIDNITVLLGMTVVTCPIHRCVKSTVLKVNFSYLSTLNVNFNRKSSESEILNHIDKWEKIGKQRIFKNVTMLFS